MFVEKGPLTAVEALALGIVDLIVSPFVFVIRYITSALLLPIHFLTTFFDLSTP